MRNLIKTELLALLFIVLHASLGTHGLVCYQTCSGRFSVQKPCGQRSCMILETVYGTFRSCANGLYISGEKRVGEGYVKYYFGAGSAGCVLAARLSEDSNLTVLLLEAGDDDRGNLILSTPLLFPFVQFSTFDWSYYTETQQHAMLDMNKQKAYYPLGKGLGGTSNLNLNIYTRGSRHDYDGWSQAGCKGWSYKDVLPYFLKSEYMQDEQLAKSEYHSVKGPLPVTIHHVTSLTERFLQAGRELGYSEVDYNGNNMIGMSRVQLTINNGVRGSTSRAFLHPVMGRSNLHVSVNSHVTKVIIRNKQVIGVEFTKHSQTYTVRCRREVILSAGSIHSPKLLMLSGIGHREELERHNIEVVADLPVGLNLQDHLMFGLSTTTNLTDLLTKYNVLKPSNLWQYITNGTGWLANGPIVGVGFAQLDKTNSAMRPDKPDVQFHLSAMVTEQEAARSIRAFNYNNEAADHIYDMSEHLGQQQGLTILITVLNPRSRGRVRLRSGNPSDPPVIDPNYLSHDDDVKLAVKALREAQRLLNTTSMKEIGVNVDAKIRRHPGCERKFTYNTDEYWRCYIRSTSVTLYHPTSTCKMGAINDPTTVVEPDLRIKGVAGLRVVDASVMPDITSGNTNAPTIMIAEKASDLIRGFETVEEMKGAKTTTVPTC